MRHVANILFASSLMMLFGACADTVIYVNKKEKVIERNAPPSPGYVRQSFYYGEASGDANVMWVVDNTEGSQALTYKARGVKKSHFQQGYEQVVKALTSEERFRRVGLRGQVAATPSGTIPFAPMKSAPVKTQSELVEDHLKGMFELPKEPDFLRGIFISNSDARGREMRELGEIAPLKTLETLKADAVFGELAAPHRYVVFVLATRASVPHEKTEQEFRASLSPEMSISQTRVFNVLPSDDRACFPSASRPENFLVEQQKIGWNVHPVEGDLCSGKPLDWANAILDWIHAGQSSMRLSFMPQYPSHLKVIVVPNRKLEFGSEFTYSAETNSISISPDLIAKPDDKAGGKIRKGDYIEVSYEKVIPDPLGDK